MPRAHRKLERIFFYGWQVPMAVDLPDERGTGDP